jgi:hypothetical protein
MRGVFATVISKGNMCVLTNVHKAMVEDDFCDECKELTNLPMLKISEHHQQWGQKANSYSVSQRT